jgi:TRAP-type C4-dicarboxylate transport system substrate-binding protein
MTRKLGLVIVLAFLVSVLAAPAIATAKTEISLSLIIPPKHLRYINVLGPWVKMVEEKTGGEVKMTVYFAAAMAKPPQTFESVMTGIADIAEGIVYATPGQFPLTEMVMLPELGLQTSEACSKALWKAYNEIPAVKEEWNGVKMLWLHTTPGIKLITRDKPVRTLEDLKGMKIRVSGATAVKMGKALGFTPVSMPMGDLYLGLEKGVIDGVALPSEILVSRRLGEVAKYVTNIDLGHDAFFIVMNQAKWDDLSPEIQKVLTELSGAWAVDFTAKGWDKFDAEAEVTNKKSGIEYIDLSAEEKAKWQKLLTPVKDEYAAEMDKKGMPGTEVLQFLLKQSK